MLKGVVPEAINEQAFEFLDLHPHGTPVEILEEDWFVENVILNAQGSRYCAVASGEKLCASHPDGQSSR